MTADTRDRDEYTRIAADYLPDEMADAVRAAYAELIDLRAKAAVFEPAREASGNAIYLDADGTVRDAPSFIAPPADWRPLYVHKEQP